MKTTKRDDLFAAILANPEDDSVRLVYADCLEEEGELARAMLIHRQVERARLPRWDRRYELAKRECAALLATHGERWRAELPVLPGIEWTTFERGFCSSVRVASVAALYAHAAAIGAAAPVHRAELHALDEAEHPWVPGAVPWLRILRFAPEEQVSPRRTDSLISATPELELELEEWDLAEWLDARAPTAMLERLVLFGDHTVGLQFAQRVAAAPWAKQLTTLALGTEFRDYDTGYFNDPTMRGAGAVALASARLGHVRHLDLTNQRLGGDGLAVVIATMTDLRELHAARCELGDLGAVVAQWGDVPLDVLDLSDNAIGNAGVEAIASAPRFAQLGWLALRLCEIGAPGLVELTHAPCWSTLHQLDLGNNPLGVDGMLALIEAAPPPKLHALSLADANLTGELIEKLAALPWFAALETLDLSNNALGGAALERIAGCEMRALRLASTGLTATDGLAPAWTRLVKLSLSGNALRATGLDGLITDDESPLTELDLTDCQLTSESLARLGAARCPQLRALRLAGNPLDAAQFAALLHAPICATIRELDVSRCGLDNAIIPVLANAPALDSLRVLRLRGHHFQDRKVLEIAALPTLSKVTHWGIDSSPWSLPQEDRDRLVARFGPQWWWESTPYVPYNR